MLRCSVRGAGKLPAMRWRPSAASERTVRCSAMGKEHTAAAHTSVHLVHVVGDPMGMAFSTALHTIARRQRYERESPEVDIRPVDTADDLALELTEPASVIVFTGSGTGKDWLGSGRVRLPVDDIASRARRPLNTNGLILDYCFGWGLRDQLAAQSKCDFALLGSVWRVPSSHSWLITTVVAALLAPATPLIDSPDNVLAGIERGIGAAKRGWSGAEYGRWQRDIVQPAW